MPPNFSDIPETSPVKFVDGPKSNGSAPVKSSSSDSTGLKTVRSLTTLVAHMLIGTVTGVSIIFAFRELPLPLNKTKQHVILCVLGFQFLMAEGILCLAPDSWLSTLGLKHKRWIHWILQVVGSILALVGCFILILDKERHWNTLHGKYALVAMVFTTVSLVNGLASMYTYQLRGIVPGILSKLTHISFGVVAFVSASISLAYGFDKGSYRKWANDYMADATIVITAAMTTIVIINPCITFFARLSNHFKK